MGGDPSAFCNLTLFRVNKHDRPAAPQRVSELVLASVGLTRPRRRAAASGGFKKSSYLVHCHA